MARSTKQQTATITAPRPNARTAARPAKTASAGSNGAVKVTRQHDGAPGLGHPIFDQLIDELGDPRSSA